LSSKCRRAKSRRAKQVRPALLRAVHLDEGVEEGHICRRSLRSKCVLHLCTKQIRPFVDAPTKRVRKLLIHEGFDCTICRTARFAAATRLEAFSPKLNRRVRLFDHCSFQQWVRLEADPEVLSLCERPSRVGPKPDDTMVDFWVRRHDRSERVPLERTPQPRAAACVGGVPVCPVTAVELAAARVWIANWQRMLPVIYATRWLFPRGLSKSVVNCVREPVALARVEHECPSATRMAGRWRRPVTTVAARRTTGWTRSCSTHRLAAGTAGATKSHARPRTGCGAPQSLRSCARR